MSFRKPNRSRRIVKKLMKRAVPMDWTRDAFIADGKRVVTMKELVIHGLIAAVWIGFRNG